MDFKSHDLESSDESDDFGLDFDFNTNDSWIHLDFSLFDYQNILRFKLYYFVTRDGVD